MSRTITSAYEPPYTEFNNDCDLLTRTRSQIKGYLTKGKEKNTRIKGKNKSQNGIERFSAYFMFVIAR